MSLSIESARSMPEDVEAVAVGVTKDRLDGPGVDWDFLRSQGFEGGKGEVRVLPGSDGRPTFAVGLGPAREIDAATIRRAAGALARAAKRHSSLGVDLGGALGDQVQPPQVAAAVAEGLALGGYRYTAFKSSPEGSKLERAVVVGAGGKRVTDALERAGKVTGAVCMARDLVNEPGGSLTPKEFAARAVKAGEEAGFEVTVWDEKQIKAERLGGLLGVNRGSAQPPRFLQLRYEPERPRGTVALVGKGITFDSGGLSLKTGEGMIGMKGDMGGAAAVLGAFRALAQVGSKARILGFVPLTDNMTGPDATRVGDVLRIRNGKTVEVLNTDAEGRLVLADALSLATEAEPDAIVDLATLTGACMVALGDRTAGLMGNHRGWVDQVGAAAGTAGEPVWPLPLPGYFKAKLDSDVADMKNITQGRYGGTLSAGMFLEQFVGDGIPWAHLDIAGPSDASETDGEIVKGGTGFGIRTLVHLLSTWTKPKKSEV